MTETEKLPVVVLISGNGSNLQAIIDSATEQPIEVRAVISNRPEAYGLKRAKRAGIRTEVVNHRDYPSREAFDVALAEAIDRYQPSVIVLAGFMRILGNDFVRRYAGRMLNIHPSLLPAYRGLNTHQRAIDHGDSHHGTSVHFVTEELDGGPVILQARIPIEPDDSAETLQQRIQHQEHVIYPRVLEWIAKGRLQWQAGLPYLDGRPLDAPVVTDNPAPADHPCHRSAAG